MPRIPMTYAGKEGVPGVASAQPLAPRMDTGIADGIYEAGIAESRTIARTGAVIGDEMRRMGKEISDYVTGQKQVRDEADFLSASRWLREQTVNEYEPMMKNTSVDADGTFVPEKWGRDYNPWLSDRMGDAREKFKMSDDAYNMLVKDGQRLGHEQGMNYTKQRVSLATDAKHNQLEEELAKCIQAEDVPGAFVALSLQVRNKPELGGDLPARKRAAQASVWMTQQVKTMAADPNTYKAKDIPIPDYVDDPKKAMDRLKLEEKKIHAEYEMKDKLDKENLFNLMWKGLNEGTLSENQIDEYAKSKDWQGNPMLSEKEKNNWYRHMEEAATRKRTRTSREHGEAVEKRLTEFYLLDVSQEGNDDKVAGIALWLRENGTYRDLTTFEEINKRKKSQGAAKAKMAASVKTDLGDAEAEINKFFKGVADDEANPDRVGRSTVEGIRVFEKDKASNKYILDDKDNYVYDYVGAYRKRLELIDEVYEFAKQKQADPKIEKSVLEFAREKMLPYMQTEDRSKWYQWRPNRVFVPPPEAETEEDVESPQSFTSVEDVNAAKLPKGTIVIINGRKARVK